MGKKDHDVEVAEESMDVSQVECRLTYEEQLRNCSVIATPMAPKKLVKKLYKLVKKASEHSKEHKTLRHGLKDVQNAIRKGDTGIVVFAGDVTPIEVMCHMPAICEEKNIPYVYTPSREELGMAMGVKRCCLMLMIKEHPDYQEQYQECLKKLHQLTISQLV